MPWLPHFKGAQILPSVYGFAKQGRLKKNEGIVFGVDLIGGQEVAHEYHGVKGTE